MAEVEDTVKKIQGMKGVHGCLILNQEGVCIRHTTFAPTTVPHYCALLNGLVKKATSAIKDLDQTNDLTFIRVRTKTSEIMIAPGGEFTFVVIQDPNADP